MSEHHEDLKGILFDSKTNRVQFPCRNSFLSLIPTTVVLKVKVSKVEASIVNQVHLTTH